MSVAEICHSHGVGLTTNDEGAIVTNRALPIAEAHALVVELRAAGHEADDARNDLDAEGTAWVYVTEAQ